MRTDIVSPVALVPVRQAKLKSYFTKDPTQHVFNARVPKKLPIFESHMILIVDEDLFFGCVHEYERFEAIHDAKQSLLDTISQLPARIIIFGLEETLEMFSTELSRPFPIPLDHRLYKPEELTVFHCDTYVFRSEKDEDFSFSLFLTYADHFQ